MICVKEHKPYTVVLRVQSGLQRGTHMSATGYVAAGSAVLFSGLVVASYAFGTADDSSRGAAEATVAYADAATNAPVANAEHRHVRVISINADTASSDGLPWYARTMQPPAPPRLATNARAVSKTAQVRPRDAEKARTKRRAPDVQPRDVAERAPA